MAAIDDLTAAVTAAVNEMNVLAAKVTDLTNQLANATGNGVTDTQLEGLASQLTTATNAALGAQGAPAAAPAEPTTPAA